MLTLSQFKNHIGGLYLRYAKNKMGGVGCSSRLAICGFSYPGPLQPLPLLPTYTHLHTLKYLHPLVQELTLKV